MSASTSSVWMLTWEEVLTLMPRRQPVCEKEERKKLGSSDETQADRDRRLKQHGS